VSERAARWLAFAALIALLVPLLFLAGGLPGTEFSDGRPFDEQEPVRHSSPAGTSGLRPLDYALAYGPVVVLIVILLICVVLSARRHGVGKRRSLLQITLLCLVMLALALIARDRIEENLQASNANAGEVLSETLPEALASDQLGPPPEEPPPAESSDARATSLLFQVFFGVVALAASVALGVAIARLRLKRPLSPAAPSPEDLLAPLETALDRLRQGRDAAGVVEQCYRDMMAQLAATLKVDPRALTPREFARAVTDLGWGGRAISDLTELFELVRYGRRADEPLAPRALQCMTQFRDRLAAAGADS
jgi:hypothetical protein